MSRVSWEILGDSQAKPPRESRLIWCPGAGRAKLQFESLRKAESYIRWNSGEIRRESGKAPVRAYYCQECCCYHVTSTFVPGTNLGKREGILQYLNGALSEKSPAAASRLFRKAEGLLAEVGDAPKWVRSVKAQVDVTRGILGRREYDTHWSAAMEHLRTGNLRGARAELAWLEGSGRNPERTLEVVVTLADLL